MSSAAPASEYEPLRQSPEPKEWDDSELKETPLPKPYSCLAYVSLFLCVAFSLANILVTVRWSPDTSARAPLSAPVTSKNVHLLRIDRRVLVTPTISTIIQFSKIDWGMEDCRMYASIPALSGAVKAGNISLVL
ncbi:hypothetical protein B0H14DRAFT_662173 [Mycena olivaceomarginata]|nr:hypothetical protein B0H14DRAFT_662173 [Mycena olivaceomarginata]